MIFVPFRSNNRSGNVIIHAYDDLIKADFISDLYAPAEQFASQPIFFRKHTSYFQGKGYVPLVPFFIHSVSGQVPISHSLKGTDKSTLSFKQCASCIGSFLDNRAPAAIVHRYPVSIE